MRKRIAIKDHIQEIQLINRRCITSFIIMLALIFILICRLGYLQLAKKDLYTTLSQNNWLDLIPLEPTRGLIYDRNGIMLAENVPVFSLDVVPDKITNVPKLLADIAKIVPLSDTDIAQFQKQLKQHRRFDEVTLKLSLSEVEVAHFAENQYRFPGVAVKAHLIRNYPYTTTFSHALGYVGRISLDELNDIDPANYSATNYIGKLGIEKFYEDELHGTVGYQQAETDASGAAVRVIKQTNPIPGKNLYLTIDSKLQIIAEQALAGHRGAVVAIQPATGEILALVSEPSYDPNLFIEGINANDYKALHDSPNRPLYNRALRGLYPPASTVKPLMAIAALSFGVINPEFSLYDPGWYQINGVGHVFHDWKRHGHGTVNLRRAIVSSCDTYFFNLAHHMGIQHMDDMLTRFGYGDFTGIDVEEELPGVVASPEWKKRNKGMAWYPGDTLITGIGQGYMLVTPLQLANAVATIANRG
jgi:penicillin-binding protein 2